MRNLFASTPQALISRSRTNNEHQMNAIISKLSKELMSCYQNSLNSTKTLWHTSRKLGSQRNLTKQICQLSQTGAIPLGCLVLCGRCVCKFGAKQYFRARKLALERKESMQILSLKSFAISMVSGVALIAFRSGRSLSNGQPFSSQPQ